MKQLDINNLISSIKQDNLAVFSAQSKDNLNIRIGRFPLLTICYMYSAKKILKKFKKELWQIKDYKAEPEQYELYQKFRTLAGRCLRLYTNENVVVTPIEMLAIMHEDSLVKQLYRKNKHSLLDKVKRNLKAIYTIHKQSPQILTYKIKIKPRELSRKEKLPYKLGIVFSLVFVCLFSSILLTLGVTTGLGTENNPYKIHTTKQLISAMSSKANYVLTKDIEIEENKLAKELTSSIDGNGHTITISSITTSSLIENNKGTIKNLKLVYKSKSATISSSLSLFVKNNNGNINNVQIHSNELNINCNKSTINNIYISGFANTNKGLIDKCSIIIDSNITTNGTGECFVSGIVGENKGTIRECSVLENSKILANEADIAGIAITNEPTAKIEHCKNNSQIHQDSEINEWSPTIAGITLHNYGDVVNCINNGDLSITSSNSTENAQGNIFIGGISANNFGIISKSLNKGNITATSDRLITYAGGICAYASYWNENNTTSHHPTLDNCGTTGILNITTNNDNVFAFAGGIAGSYQYGDIIDCYSLSDFTNSFNQDKYFFGLLLGSSYLDLWFNNIYLSPNNNYVAYSDNVEHHIGCLINSNTIVSTGANLNQGVTVTTSEQIKLQEVYFDE